MTASNKALQLINHISRHPECRGRIQLIFSDNAKGELIYRISLDEEDFDLTITPIQTRAQQHAHKNIREALNIKDTKRG